jgi:hypothetical protein
VEELPDIEEVDILEDNEDNIDSTFKLEEESEAMIISLMIFCFFEDMHRLQDFLHDIWKGYKARKVELMTASLITNAAIDIVRQSEEEILAAAPKLSSKKGSYNAIAIVIFRAEAFLQGRDPDAKLSLVPTPFDDFIYLSTAKTLWKFEYLRKVPSETIIDYPLPSPPLRFGYISRPDLLGNPYMDRKEREDTTLSQLMIDLCLFGKFCNLHAEEGLWKYPAPAEDELTAGLRKLMKEDTLSVWLVFASRMFLDIQDMLGEDIKRGKKIPVI